ncbi:MAG: hypothetical protein ABL926_07320 [Novosphingobium sp.]|uniref:hypothetical protein n=1 Tax=Novosphingobium sp. TaxID=1874826 RepID=UPI0032B80927
MYEFTMGGLWFRWSALDRTSKWLAGPSLAAAGLAPLPGAWITGLRLGRGESLAAPLDGWVGLWMVGWLVVSGLLWWAVSRRQDEMFNRIQNWTIGMASSWAMLALVIWALLARASVVVPVSPIGIILCFGVAFFVFWFIAVKRWA